MKNITKNDVIECLVSIIPAIILVSIFNFIRPYSIWIFITINIIFLTLKIIIRTIRSNKNGE